MDQIKFDALFPAISANDAMKEWESKLNAICLQKTGLHLADLPDQPFADMFEDGLTPLQAWKQIKSNLADDGY